MKLTELNPELDSTGQHLVFDCPKCRTHHVGVNATWGDLSQSFEKMTLQHSVRVLGDESCKAHFSVINGEVTMAD